MYTRDEQQRDAAFLNTLGNGVRVVELLADQRRTLREIAGELGMQRQSVYRLVHTLDVLGWVSRRAADDTYSLTPAFAGLAMRADQSEDLRERWSPRVVELSKLTGETVHLAIYDRGFSVYIGKEDGWHPIRSYTQLGGRSPARCVATGKVLLAHQPSAERLRVIDAGIEPFTARTITGAEAIESELAKVVERGYAINLGEYRAEVGGVAVPVRAASGAVVAALGFSGPVQRIESRMDELLELLREATRSEESRGSRDEGEQVAG